MPLYTIEWMIALFGITGNLTLMRIYLGKDRKIRFNNLMILIAFFDSLYVLTDLTSTVLDSTYKYIPTEDFNIISQIINFMGYWSFSGSVYTTALIAFERYLSLCKEK